MAATTHAGLLGIPLVAGGVVLLMGAKRMPRRTAKGTGTLRRVQGFRRFIEESEKERAQFAEKQHLFSEYLPYAIVFGATEKWAKAFAGIDGRLPDTGWYTGPNYFTVGSFSDSMDGFATTTVGDDLVHAVGVGRQRLQRGRVLRRGRRRGRRRFLVGEVAGAWGRLRLGVGRAPSWAWAATWTGTT